MATKKKPVTLTPELREEIIQQFIARGTRQAAASACNVGIRVVAKVLSETPPEEVARARTEMMVEMASVVNDKVRMFLNGLVPADMSGANGKTPNVMQKVTATAIMIDKFVLLQKHMHEYEQMMAERAATDRRPLPADVQAMVAGIQRSLAQLAPIAPQVAPKVETAVEPDPESIPEADATPRRITLDDLDYPNGRVPEAPVRRTPI